MNKIIYESFKGKVIFKTKYNAYFKENLKVFDAVEFIGQAVQHIPVPRIRLIRYFGLYSSKSRGKWQSLFCTSCAATAFGHRVQQKDWDHIARLAPLGWKEQNGIEKQEEDDNNNESCNEDNVSSNKNKASWARLIAKIYEVDPLVCPKCGSEMRIIAVITYGYEINKILKHLIKTGKSPPSVDESLLN